MSNPLLKSFGNVWLSLADTVTTGTYIFLSLIVKIILLPLLSLTLSLTLSLPFAEKTRYFVHSSFNHSLQ